MAAKVYVKSFIQLVIDGNSVDFGSFNQANVVNVDGEHKDDRRTVTASGGTETLWDKTLASEGLGDFDFLAIAATGDCTLEFIVDSDNSIGTVVFTVELKGGKDGLLGAPFILASDGSNANASAGFGGTIDTIDKIAVKNAGSSDITVRMLMVT